jgi:hypothetical protein
VPPRPASGERWLLMRAGGPPPPPTTRAPPGGRYRAERHQLGRGESDCGETKRPGETAERQSDQGKERGRSGWLVQHIGSRSI